MKYLVTGGAGLIGSALVWALNQRGIDDIVVTDFLGTTEKWRNLAPLRFADYVEADDFARRIQERADAFGHFDAVFHLGACSSTTERDAAYLIRNNYECTKQLALWSMARQSRFIYASSAATYGDGAQGMDDMDTDLQRLRPLNMYGYSKHLFDLHAQREGWLERIAGMKYFNVFGPNEDHKGDMRSLVNKAYRQILDTGRVQLFRSHRPDYRDGEQQRDFLYVKDAVEMTLHFAFEGRRASGLYNLGSGEANTWITLTTALFEAMGRQPAIEYIDMPENLRAKYQYHTCADTTKLRKAGHTRPVTPLKVAVGDYVRNHLMTDARLGA